MRDNTGDRVQAAKTASDFAGSADSGFRTNRNIDYFGYKLVAVTTLQGIPVVYDTCPANTDERLQTESVINSFVLLRHFADMHVIFGINTNHSAILPISYQMSTPIIHLAEHRWFTVFFDKQVVFVQFPGEKRG